MQSLLNKIKSFFIVLNGLENTPKNVMIALNYVELSLSPAIWKQSKLLETFSKY